MIFVSTVAIDKRTYGTRYNPLLSGSYNWLFVDECLIEKRLINTSINYINVLI